MKRESKLVKDKLQEIVDCVYQNYNRGIGNEKLYELCGNGPHPDTEGKIRVPETPEDIDKLIRYLSAQLWLIGRGYAASPERRNYGSDYSAKGNDQSLSDFKKENGQVGDGTSSFFDDLAKNIIDNKQYGEFVNKLDKLRDKNYSLENDKTDSDKDILEQVVALVESFNTLLKEATEACDEGILDNYDKKYRNGRKGTRTDNLSNKISFCSKFLHFHLPSVVFIFDSYSEDHLNCFNARNNDAKLQIEGVEISITRNDVNKIKKNIQFQYQEDYNQYICHCCRAYLVAKALYGNSDYKPDDKDKNEYCKNLPRIIDMLALLVNGKR